MSVVPPVEVGLGLAEDQAIKAKVTGLTLPTDKPGGTMPVPVRFRMPSGEFNPAGSTPSQPSGVQYPLITIDLQSITYDRKRDHVNNIEISYVPDIAPEMPDDTLPGITEYPLPVHINYMITAWTTSAQHNAQLRAALLAPDRLPLRFGWLYVPADDTWRQMDSNAMRSDHFVDDQQRRIFRTIFTVAVEAETLKTALIQPLGVVEEVILDPPTNVPDHQHGVH